MLTTPEAEMYAHISSNVHEQFRDSLDKAFTQAGQGGFHVHKVQYEATLLKDDSVLYSVFIVWRKNVTTLG